MRWLEQFRDKDLAVILLHEPIFQFYLVNVILSYPVCCLKGFGAE